MMTFCTLFDSKYLDKGLAMYESLQRVSKKAYVYILAMDDRCLKILNELKLDNAIVISLDSFEDDELKRIKEQRTRAEYCWTCTASLIDYVFKVYGEEYCTYVDSDLYFYEDPQVLIKEMCDSGCSVQIVKHGFGHGKKALRKEQEHGKYCVQFNTFKNDECGRKILKIWKEQCRRHCSMAPGELGDQKYLNDWEKRYKKVHVLEHPGGGIAPWNIKRYQYMGEKDDRINLMDKQSKTKFEIVFYHFHHLEYIDAQQVDINVFKYAWGIDRELIKHLYLPYLEELEKLKRNLDTKFQFVPVIYKHSGIVVQKSGGVRQVIREKGVRGLVDKIRTKFVYVMGKKKDIIDLAELSIDEELRDNAGTDHTICL